MQHERATFPGLAPEHFTHPADDAALRSVRNLPLINSVMKKMFQYGFEKMLRVQAMSETIKTTRRSYPKLYDMARDAANRLDLPEPDLFVQQNPVPNARTTGAEYPFIVVTSGLIELLNDDEVYAAVAHETGHIKAGHVLYHMVARFMTMTAQQLGVVGLPLQGLLFALLEWSRKSEFTSDRAALLCTQDVGLVQSSLMKLAGGAHRMEGDVDFEDFLKQGEMFDAMTSGMNLNKFYRMLAALPMTHPFPVVRAAEIGQWSHSEQYGVLVRREYEARAQPERKPAEVCPHCGASLSGTERQCHVCGNGVVSMGADYTSAGDDLFREAFNQAATQVSETVNKAFDDLRGFFTGRPQEAPPETEQDSVMTLERICTGCGTVNEADASYCKNCGQAL